MYSLKCSYYDKSFKSIDELVDDVLLSGVDPFHEVTLNGRPTGEILIDLITP